MSENELNPDHGIDPRQTFCRRCKCETSEIIVGENRLMINTGTGQTALAPKDQIQKVAEKLDWSEGDYSVSLVPPGRLPATDFCASCKKEVAHFETVVAAGGVYYQCLDCKSQGVIADSEFAKMIREKNGIAPPEPCGVEFEDCSLHDGMTF